MLTNLWEFLPAQIEATTNDFKFLDAISSFKASLIIISSYCRSEKSFKGRSLLQELF